MQRFSRKAALLLGSAALATWAAPLQAAEPATDGAGAVEQVTVTARLRSENAQDVPIALSVIGADTLNATQTYDVSQLTQLAPSLQFSSSNPRNTNLTIRGLGSSFGLANDGLEPGVGLYVDQVYYARPAAATFDFVDIDQVEVLRGPQGTLFGKNTTAGALNITTAAPSFTPQSQLELSVGDDGFLQGKASVSGPLAGNVLAGRLSITSTRRDGLLDNVTTGQNVNALNDFGIRGQLLYRPNDSFRLRLSADYNNQEANCCTQVFVGIGQTLKPAAQQFPALAASLGYAPPSLNPYDRKADINSPIHADQNAGGVSAIADWDFGPATFTSVSAWRYWNWDSANDRDYTSLPILTQSANPDQQKQYSQEFRVASNGKHTIDYVVGLYGFWQTIKAEPVAEYGADATRWLLTPTTLPANLLDGYRSDAVAKATTDSYAVFGQVTWNITDRLSFTPGLRYTDEGKDGSYNQTVSGGLQTSDASLVAKQLSIVRPQSYTASFWDGSVSGQADLAYHVTDDSLVYANFARGYKSGGINMAGIPTDAAGNPSLTNAVVKPEIDTTYELGVKNQFFAHRLTLNLDAFNTNVHDYQANVVDSGPGALRGYLANVDAVRVHGVELDSSFLPTDSLSGYLSGTWSEGKYASFANGPCPLELIGSATTSCDLSGKPLPGLSHWALSAGGEYHRPAELGAFSGEAFAGVEASYHSSFYSDASDSKYTLIKGYGLANVNVGVRAGSWELSLWVKNLFDQHYLQFVSIQSGNSGLILGLPGDQRTVGLTLRTQY